MLRFDNLAKTKISDFQVVGGSINEKNISGDRHNMLNQAYEAACISKNK
jgi:hypothetical protein